MDLRKQGVPDSAAKGIEEHANSHMEKGIEKLSAEIVQAFYNGKGGGRRNELRMAVKFSLNNIANRIEHGYNIEVRCAPLASGEPQSDNDELKKALAVVQNAAANMQFLKLEGSEGEFAISRGAVAKPRTAAGDASELVLSARRAAIHEAWEKDLVSESPGKRLDGVKTARSSGGGNKPWGCE